ncbi:MAG: outer membrane protein transport protein [Nitrospirales bacterium]|nr:outer membrane protein transport protein [Nitrospirales bacterium]
METNGGSAASFSPSCVNLLTESAPRVLLFICLLSAVWPSAVSASSFRILDQGAGAAGQSNAFTAQADDPSAIYYNPAGMMQLRGVQTYFGTTLLGGSTSFRNAAGQTARGDFNGSIAYPPPSNIYITGNLQDLGVSAPVLRNMAVGVGLTFPFGTLYRWPNNGPFSTATTGAALQLLNIKPTVAYKFNDRLSVGLGLDIYTFSNLIGEGQYEQRLISSGGPGLPPAGTPLEINGKDTALGFNTSFLYTPLLNGDGKPLANIGMVYRSQATLHLNGDFLAGGTSLSQASTTLVLPQVLTGGIAIWPVRDHDRDWKLEVDVDYTGWKSIRNLDVHLSPALGTIPFPQNYRSGYTIMVGTEYKWLHPEVLPNWEIALRAGYWHSQSPTPDAAFNPSVPDADNHSISVGLGLLCKEGGRFLGLFECAGSENKFLRAVGLDVAYKALLYETRTVSGNANPVAIPGSVNGRYQTTYHVGSVNLRVNF